jgi:hypothetical protein
VAECGDAVQAAVALVYYSRYAAIFWGDERFAGSGDWDPTARLLGKSIPL